MTRDEVDDPTWKTQYREILGDLERKERAWSTLESALRRAASQLAIAAMGQSEALDSELDNVLDLVKSGDDPNLLGDAFTGLASALKVLETERRASARAEPDEAQAQATMFAAIRTAAQRIAATPGLGHVATEFDRRFQIGVPETDPQKLLSGLADTIAQAVDSVIAQKRELEEFLEQVTQQLVEFENWTARVGEETQSRHSDSLELEKTVQLEITGLHEDVDDVVNLKDLKLKVQMRLDSVAAQLREFRASEELRFAAAEKRNVQLRDELSQFKTKTDNLMQLCRSQTEQLMLDALTKVHSRFAYEARLSEEYERWRRHRQPLTFSMWDIDYFKTVNDTFGHDAGDRLLQLIANILHKLKRADDFVARIGGEEFVVLLPQTDCDAGLTIANRMRVAIGNAGFHYRGKPERVTISCGLTEFRADDTPASVYNRADKALYEAKQAGRDRCVAL
jgi:diguanylate cyclase